MVRLPHLLELAFVVAGAGAAIASPLQAPRLINSRVSSLHRDRVDRRDWRDPPMHEIDWDNPDNPEDDEEYLEWYKETRGRTPEEDRAKEGEILDEMYALYETAPEIYSKEFKENMTGPHKEELVQIGPRPIEVPKFLGPERIAELEEIEYEIQEVFERSEAWAADMREMPDRWAAKQWHEEQQSANCESVVFDRHQAAKSHMQDGDYIQHLDSWIAQLDKDAMKKEGRDEKENFPWLEQYEMEWGTGARDTDGSNCRSLTHSCNPGTKQNCDWYWKNSTEDHKKLGYWAFQTIQGVHDKLKSFDQTLTGEVLLKSLNLKNLEKDFDTLPEPEDEFLKWFNFALGLGGNALGKMPVVRNADGTCKNLNDCAIEAGAGGVGYINEFVDLFTTLSELGKNEEDEEDETIDYADMESALGGMLNQTRHSIKTTLKIALGDKKFIDDWDTLPSFGNQDDKKFKTPIGKFLYNGIWLLDNDDPFLENIMSEASANIERKLVDIKIRSEGWHVTWDNRPKERDCDRRGDFELDYGGKKCFRLYQIKGDDKPTAADDEFYEKMAKHGFRGDDLKMYYAHVLDCYRHNGKDGQIDGKDQMLFKTPPRCMFNTRVAKIELPGSSNCNNMGTNCQNWSVEDL